MFGGALVRLSYGPTLMQRKDHAVVNLFWFCVGFASGLREWTNHGPCCCVASMQGEADKRRVREDP